MPQKRQPKPQEEATEQQQGEHINYNSIGSHLPPDEDGGYVLLHMSSPSEEGRYVQTGVLSRSVFHVSSLTVVAAPDAAAEAAQVGQSSNRRKAVHLPPREGGGYVY